MGRLKWFDRFLTNEIAAQNRFLRRRRRKNRFLRPIKEITPTMVLSPEWYYIQLGLFDILGHAEIRTLNHQIKKFLFTTD